MPDVAGLAEEDGVLADVDGEVADARIEYAGNGSIQRAAREGWLSKFFSMISPF